MHQKFLWLSQREKVPERERHMIQSKIHIGNGLESGRFRLNICSQKGRKFNAMHYVTERLSSLSDWRASDVPESSCKLMMRADNARPHKTRLSIEFFRVIA
jgi:hypothetical protein